MADATRIEDRLKAVDLFSTLSGKEIKKLVEAGTVVEHEAGKEITGEGRLGVALHLVLSGDAQVAVGGRPRSSVGPDQYFGEISLLDGKPRSATVTAGQAGLTTFALTSWNFNNVLDKHPEMAKPLIAGLCARLRAAESA